MRNLILKVIRLYKMVNFTSDGGVVISYGGSKIKFTGKGDIIVNARRHTIHNRQLFFDSCDKEFIDSTIKAHEKGEDTASLHLECRNLANELEGYKDIEERDLVEKL